MKKQINVGDELPVEFIRNHSSGRPVCRVEGKVAFIDKKVTKFVPPGSVWWVRVLSVYERYVTIEPIMEIRTVKEQEVLKKEQLSQLLKFPEKKKEKKVKTQYLFKSFQEIKNEK